MAAAKVPASWQKILDLIAIKEALPLPVALTKESS